MILNDGLQEIGFSEAQIAEFAPKLEKYVSELELFNPTYNLVGADTHEDILIRHILDSLAAYKPLCELIEKAKQLHPDRSIQLADIGSGGGLPGIPLSIVFPDYQFTLVERMTKRYTFLVNCCAVLGLKNVTVSNLEAERVSQNSFDIIVFRAFRPLEKKMTKVLLRMLQNDGCLAAYKAKTEKINAEMEQIKEYVPTWESIPLQVPFLHENERHLVIIPKNKKAE